MTSRANDLTGRDVKEERYRRMDEVQKTAQICQNGIFNGKSWYIERLGQIRVCPFRHTLANVDSIEFRLPQQWSYGSISTLRCTSLAGLEDL